MEPLPLLFLLRTSEARISLESPGWRNPMKVTLPMLNVSIPALGRQKAVRVALYSHDTMGIGHMRRNLLIAQTLSAPPVSATMLLIAGAREASTFSMPANVDCLTLPSIFKTVEGKYRSRALNVSLRELIALRSQTIASALAAFAPDVLIVDKEPRGTGGELESALERLRKRGRTRCILGLRDVLDDPDTVRREWRAAANEKAVRDYYDAVWVYGDPSVYDLVNEYRFSADLRSKVAFTGYLDPCIRLRLNNGNGQQATAEPGCPPSPFVLCMVGGGQDGAQLAEAFAASELPQGQSGVIVAGPYMPPDARQRLSQRAAANRDLHVLDFVSEPCRIHRRAERVVAMGGYNTVSEVLAFEKPALIVPRVKPRQEQMIRASRLHDLGLLDVMHPDDVSPSALSRWLCSNPASCRHARQSVNLDGTKRLPGLLQSVLKTSLPTTREVCHAVS